MRSLNDASLRSYQVKNSLLRENHGSRALLEQSSYDYRRLAVAFGLLRRRRQARDASSLDKSERQPLQNP